MARGLFYFLNVQYGKGFINIKMTSNTGLFIHESILTFRLIISKIDSKSMKTYGIIIK